MKHFAHFTEGNETFILSGYHEHEIHAPDKIITTKDIKDGFDFKSYTAAHLVAMLLKDLDKDKSHQWAVLSKQ